MTCPICLSKAAQSDAQANDVYRVDCAQCGPYRIDYIAKANAKTMSSELRWKVSAWVAEHLYNEVLDAVLLQEAEECQRPGVLHRATRMLAWIARQFPPGRQFQLTSLGKTVVGGDNTVPWGLELETSSLVPIGWNTGIDEMSYMVTEFLCNELGWLTSQNNFDYHVSPKGLFELEGRSKEQSSIGFCAMWFSPEVQCLWTDVIRQAIRASGYEPLRVDTKEHNGRIDDEIVASVRSARFVVADFTKHRGGVYYEAGFAHGLGLPVIFMCRKDHVKLLHFDIRQYNCIIWSPDSLDDARDRLKNRILATLGQGPLKG